MMSQFHCVQGKSESTTRYRTNVPSSRHGTRTAHLSHPLRNRKLRTDSKRTISDSMSGVKLALRTVLAGLSNSLHSPDSKGAPNALASDNTSISSVGTITLRVFSISKLFASPVTNVQTNIWFHLFRMLSPPISFRDRLNFSGQGPYSRLSLPIASSNQLSTETAHPLFI